jgi:glycerol-3-phosphate acyltransferase PlsY
VSYLLGCFTTAYYLVRFKLGQDIRELGSSNAGAKNASRVLGPSAFGITFFGDAAKGTLALAIAHYAGVNSFVTMLCLIAVILGHLYPIQLQFRGGKGIAVAIGATLIINPPILFLLLIIFIILFALSRNFTVSGLTAVGLAPIMAFFLQAELIQILGLAIGALLIIVAHKQNIRQIMKDYQANRTL